LRIPSNIRLPCHCVGRGASTATYPTPVNLRFNRPMHPVLSSCRVFLTVLRDLIAGVRAKAGVARPAFASQAVTRQVAAGLRLVEAYLRRVLIVMALEIEPSLVDAAAQDDSGPLPRPDGRKRASSSAGFRVLDDGRLPLREDWHLEVRDWHRPTAASRAPMAMGRLYRRLDQLAAIAADPLRRARRLAFHLARCRPGLILAPDIEMRPPLTWRPEAALGFNALAHEIINRSRNRPPPLPPPRRHGPSVIVLGCAQ
jgi:hypothetical protein